MIKLCKIKFQEAASTTWETEHKLLYALFFFSFLRKALNTQLVLCYSSRTHLMFVFYVEAGQYICPSHIFYRHTCGSKVPLWMFLSFWWNRIQKSQLGLFMITKFQVKFTVSVHWCLHYIYDNYIWVIMEKNVFLCTYCHSLYHHAVKGKHKQTLTCCPKTLWNQHKYQMCWGQKSSNI